MSKTTPLEKIVLLTFLETFDKLESFEGICDSILNVPNAVRVWPSYNYLTPNALVVLMNNHLDITKSHLGLWLIPLENAILGGNAIWVSQAMTQLKKDCTKKGT